MPSVEGHHSLDCPGGTPWTQCGLEGCGCSKHEWNHLKLTPVGPFTPNHPTGALEMVRTHPATGGDSPQLFDYHTFVALDMPIKHRHLEDKEKPGEILWTRSSWSTEPPQGTVPKVTPDTAEP